MIRHIVSWQLSEADPARKAVHAAEIAARLGALVGVVDEIRALRVGADVAGGTNWDVVLVADFDDLDAVGRYQVHPASGGRRVHPFRRLGPDGRRYHRLTGSGRHDGCPTVAGQPSAVTARGVSGRGTGR